MGHARERVRRGFGGDLLVPSRSPIIHVQDQALHLLCRSMFQPFHDDYHL